MEVPERVALGSCLPLGPHLTVAYPTGYLGHHPTGHPARGTIAFLRLASLVMGEGGLDNHEEAQAQTEIELSMRRCARLRINTHHTLAPAKLASVTTDWMLRRRLSTRTAIVHLIASHSDLTEYLPSPDRAVEASTH